MKKIYQIFKKLLGLYTNNQSDQKLKEKPIEPNIGICFSITSNLDINIECNFPDIENLNLQEIEKISEQFGELLFLINRGILKTQINQLLEHEKNKDSDNSNMVLFIDNIFSFYKLVNQEFNKITKSSTKPLIRPILAFKPYQ